MGDTTVELPADEDIKQLAHDVAREENEYAVPLLRDFYNYLAQFEEEDHLTYEDLGLENTKSQLPGTVWRSFLEELIERDVVEKHPGGRDTTYTLDVDGDN